MMKNIIYGWVTALFAFVFATSAAVITWDGSKNSAWTDPENWIGGVRPENSTSQDVARFADDSAGGNRQPVVNYGWAVGRIQFDGPDWTIGRKDTYTLNIGGGVVLNPVRAGSVMFNSRLYLGNSQTWEVGAGSTINVNGGLGGASSGLTKTGGGRLVIRGGEDNINSFGALVVSEGDVWVTRGTVDRRLVPVSVARGALFGGDGSVLRPVTIHDGGILAPGFFAAGTLTLRTLSLSELSVLEFELGSMKDPGDRIVTEDLVLDGTLNVSNLGGLEAGRYTLFSCTGTISDNGLSIGSLPSGFKGSVLVDGNEVYLDITE
ncbi:hypothetical protein [Tichowtungia aerotolerans]|uniref:Uncharacterized protein n=1 Tax=Tichowtungia aerotolerans TaxID=2697043 RepID=A0A6P1M1R5_9BACT|nr:hypothetical protein [Tichowtungia aerotolerans]QHI68530.1 hypothetical protein GT409_03360 [Tichowtungia aerotolerans]